MSTTVMFVCSLIAAADRRTKTAQDFLSPNHTPAATERHAQRCLSGLPQIFCDTSTTWPVVHTSSCYKILVVPGRCCEQASATACSNIGSAQIDCLTHQQQHSVNLPGPCSSNPIGKLPYTSNASGCRGVLSPKCISTLTHSIQCAVCHKHSRSLISCCKEPLQSLLKSASTLVQL